MLIWKYLYLFLHKVFCEARLKIEKNYQNPAKLCYDFKNSLLLF